jgi:hypothetical protein
MTMTSTPLARTPIPLFRHGALLLAGASVQTTALADLRSIAMRPAFRASLSFRSHMITRI